MQLLKIIRLIFTFYAAFFAASFVLTAVCCYFMVVFGIESFAMSFLLKVVVMAVIFFIVRSYKAKEFYYYRNLGLSPQVLWITVYAVDFLLFLLLMTLSYKYGWIFTR